MRACYLLASCILLFAYVACDFGKRPHNGESKVTGYIAIGVNNPEIIRTVETIQNDIVEKEPHLKPAVVDPTTLHVTVAIWHVRNQRELEIGNQAMQEVNNLWSLPFTISVEGLSTFNEKVLYAKIKEHERLQKVANEVKTCFSKYGLDVTFSSQFVPHITIMKTSNDQHLRRKGTKPFEPTLYEGYKNTRIGSEKVESLQILSFFKVKKGRHISFHTKEDLYTYVSSLNTLGLSGETEEPRYEMFLNENKMANFSIHISKEQDLVNYRGVA